MKRGIAELKGRSGKGVAAAPIWPLRRLLVVCLALLLACGQVAVPGNAAFADDPPTSSASAGPSASDRVQAAIAACVRGLFAGWDVADAPAFYASDELVVGDSSCEWLAYDVYRAGATEGASAFLERMEAHVSESYASPAGGLDANSPTTWARAAIVVAGLGADPSAFGVNAGGAPANLLSDGLYNWSYSESLSDQGSNALIYALLAIDATSARVPEDARYSARDMLEGLLACQAADGSFALRQGSATGSVDLTGMALAAIAPYGDDPAVADAIAAAVGYLSAQQAADGGFSSEGEATSESSAMVIVGLSACGIDAHADERFVKGGASALDALLAFQKADGTFAHTADTLADSGVKDLPTEQALRALLAYEELAQGGDGNVYAPDVKLSIGGVGPAGAGSAGGTAESGASAEVGQSTPSASSADAQASAGAVDAAAGTEPTPARPARITNIAASLAVGAAAALVVVAAIWAIRKIRRKARR